MAVVRRASAEPSPSRHSRRVTTTSHPRTSPMSSIEAPASRANASCTTSSASAGRPSIPAAIANRYPRSACQAALTLASRDDDGLIASSTVLHCKHDDPSAPVVTDRREIGQPPSEAHSPGIISGSWADRQGRPLTPRTTYPAANPMADPARRLLERATPGAGRHLADRITARHGTQNGVIGASRVAPTARSRQARNRRGPKAEGPSGHPLFRVLVSRYDSYRPSALRGKMPGASLSGGA